MHSPLNRILSALAVAALLVSTVVWFGAAPAAAQTSSTALTMTVADVVPNSPTVSTTPKPLTFTLDVVNHTTDQALNVSISAARSDPIATSEQLDADIAHPKPPSPDQVSPLTATATTKVPIPPGASQRMVIRTTTDVSPHDGVCLCANLIYPFWFIANYSSANSSAKIDGTATAQTFLPSFTKKPVKSTVSWVWPLLDRPHRLLQSKIFFDDALATELQPDGRLDKLLQVVKQVSRYVPMTLLTDPDLIDELAVMASGYQVSTPKGLITGTGSAAAQQWLDRLRTVLDQHPDVKLEFTPFADPAVDSLTRAGMSWVSFDPQEKAAVTAALGDRTPPSDLAWPVGRSLSPQTLTRLVQQGAKTVLVSDSSLSDGDMQPVPNALAPITTARGRATLAVTSGPIQRLVDTVLDPQTDGLSKLPELVAQLAVRVEADVDSNTAPYIVIAPPRDLDVNVDTAVRTIEATAHTTWSRPLTIERAVTDRSIVQVSRGSLQGTAHGPRLPHRLLRTINRVSDRIPLLIGLFHDQTVGNQLFAAFPAALQRCESTSLISDPAVAFAMAGRLQHIVRATRSAVYIVRPSNGTYTLTSKNSRLPITVVNRLNAEVDVDVSVQAVSASSGLTTQSSAHPFTIKANSKVQVHVLTHVNRVGLIPVIVQIRTTGGLVLGKPIPLSVRSTALGTIGVIITVLAAILLAVAVVIRQVRRLRKRTPREPGESPRVAAATAPST